jgi:hypothetical protein
MIDLEDRSRMANRSTRATILATGLLVGGFIGVVLWFGLVDFYHLHFFDTGWIVAADNLVRVVFVAVLCWLIYAPGAGVTALIIPAQERAILTSGERAVVGFGIGAAVWHVAMLILGLANLYYRPVMIVLCLIVLIGSARHFTTVAVSALDSDSGRFSSLWQRTGLARRLAMALVVGAGAWLLLVRGLYPGGGHDYYTHYFPYYLAVLQNHGLKPNDVWYHYYYSKGCGPIFLGMLLTDPEAPALVTFCYVAFAALGVTTLAERLAPRSLWPACGALLYVLCYIVSISAFGGGEFQKDHEEVTALVTISTWAICMAAAVAPTIFLVVATATGIAAAIVTQPAGVVLAAFFALLAGVSVLRRRWRQFSGYGLAAAAIGGTVFGILLLNYVVTGLASDQALDLMLGFANFHRLDRWGVIPQLVIVEWIRDNYDLVVQPVGWLAAYQLVYFMRLDVLWAFLSGVALLLLALCLEHYFCVRPPREDTPGTPDSVAPGIALSTIQRLGLLIGLLVAITVFAGRSQSFSFGTV